MAKPETHCEISFPKALNFSTSIAPDNTRDAVRFVFEAKGVNRADVPEVGDVCKQLDRCVQEFKANLLSHEKTRSREASAAEFAMFAPSPSRAPDPLFH